MSQDLTALVATHKKAITVARSPEELADIERSLFHKKKGLFVDLFADMAALPPAEKGEAGKALNQAKQALTQQLADQREVLATATQAHTDIDVTLPTSLGLTEAGMRARGHLHPITSTIREISTIFSQIGFTRRRYREIESDYYAFESLNIPQEHPARNDVETFYVDHGHVLSPHTSSGQVREMERGELPIRMVNISRCARRQEDVTHVPTFYQFEGLLIDKTVSIADLKGVLTYFVQNYFGEERRIRLRPYDFQFTEPSFEIDITCSNCGGNGGSCRVCKDGWLELGGAGMVHPNVLTAGKLDPHEVTGFAFGWGVERVFMMKNPKVSLPDLRMLYKNDLRFLEQF